MIFKCINTMNEQYFLVQLQHVTFAQKLYFRELVDWRDSYFTDKMTGDDRHEAKYYFFRCEYVEKILPPRTDGTIERQNGPK